MPEFVQGMCVPLIFILLETLFKYIFYNPKKYNHDCSQCKRWDCQGMECYHKRKKLKKGDSDAIDN